MTMRYIVLSIVCSLWVSFAFAQASVGKSVANVKILNSKDQQASLPHFGERVLVIFYTDPDVKDVNDALSSALKAKGFPADKYSGIGIANCKVTWIPNAAIRMKARQKEQQFPGSIVMIDDAEKLKSSWGLGDCDGKGVVIVVGKDTKIKLLRYVKSEEESKAMIAQVLKLVQEEIAK
jgi:Predicted transcriptional regulator